MTMKNYIPDNSRYDKMEYRRVGRSGLLLPEISFGLWQHFGPNDDFDNCRAMITRAFDCGVSHFDIANNYSLGESERIFGKILHSDLTSYRDELVISTKAGHRMWPGPYGEWGSRKYLLSSLDASLKRLGLEYVDIFYSHRPDMDTPLEETMGALSSAVKAGKALYVGISKYPPEMARRAASILKEMGTPCLIHQARYSMFNRDPEEGLFDVTKEEGMGVIAFQAMAQGLLTNKYLKGVPADSRVAKGEGTLKVEQITPSALSKVRKLNDLAISRGQSLAQMAIAWDLRDGRVSSVLIGASSAAQVDDSLSALKNKHFSQEELDLIDGILKD